MVSCNISRSKNSMTMPSCNPTGLRLTAVLLLAFAGAGADPDHEDTPHAVIQRAAGPITIDGRLDEASWHAASMIDRFEFPWWTSGDRERTEARLLWDDEALYVSFRAFDRHVSAVLTERDDPVSRDDAVEVFIAPDTTDADSYFNFEFNALGTILDRSPLDDRSSDWNAEGVRVAVHVDGTLNDEEDVDRLWTTEIAIPFDSFDGFSPHLPPADGDVWRLNLYRTGGAVNLQYIAWSDTRTETPAFHVPHRFGIATFSNTAASGAGVPFVEPGQSDGYPPGTLVPEGDLGLQSVDLEVPGRYRDQVPENITLDLPPGFSVKVFAAGLRGPRLMAFSPEGVLHVCNMRAGQILALPDRNHDGVADEHIVVLEDLREAHSLTFYKGDLYVAEEHQVIRALDADGDGIYEGREVFISDIPWEGWHDTRTLVFDEENGKAYLSVGSPCDLCRMEDGKQIVGHSDELVPQDPARGTVLQFDDDGTGRRIFATGVRNVIGMDFHPLTNELWGNNNGHDLEGRSAPPEWIDILRDGDFLGYPFVHSYQVWNDFAIPEYQPVLPIGRQDSLRVLTQKRPVALVPAHWAPMGIHFYTGAQFPRRYDNAAFVAFRAGKAKLSSHPGYKVQVLFSEPDGSNAAMADFLTGFQTGTTQDAVWGFPVGLATDDEGSLFVSSDNRTDLILKVTHSQIGGTWLPDLPTSVRLTGPIDVKATVNIERLAEGGSEPRVTADLSALGGPMAMPLTPSGTGTYVLDVQLTAERVGAWEIVVRIEQDVDDRTESLQFTRTIDVVPPAWRHDLPGALVYGESVGLHAVIHVEPFAIDGGEPRLTADLSAIGGPDRAPLIPVGDDDYTLDAQVDVDGAVGSHEVFVRMEQEVGGVVRAFDFTHTIVIAPPDLAVLDDQLAGGWTFSGIEGAEVLGPTPDGPVFNGRVSHAVQVAPPSLFGNWSVDLRPEIPVERQGFVGVRLVFHPGDVNIPRIPVLFLVIDELTLDLVRDPQPGLAIDLNRREWQVLEVPFTAFDQNNFYGAGLRDQVDAVDAVTISGNLTGTLYLDDVRVVTSIPAAPPMQTVVAERHDDTHPAQFALAQNYPNPFNSSTKIRFALSDPSEVDLRIYNTTGQVVATLVAGPRPSGSYTVVWDSRADYGQELASGVYFVRLMAETWLGTQIEPRKLLLLR